MATFYVVGTPIGNLEDITLRALRVLQEVDVVLCEDTRVTQKLFTRHAISTPVMSYHAHSTISKIETILDMLVGKETGKEKTGPKNIALVSDAGTPGISDPGAHLVSKIRERFSDEIARGEIKIESVPGPSALTAALSIAGVECSQFIFMGFLPHKKGRETLFKEIASQDRPVVLYESPHRIMKTLGSLVLHFSSIHPGRTIAIARELSKIYEEVVRGAPSEVITFFERNPDKIRGEFVVIVEAPRG
jgi:16S rRNA (cytidine1402-2'-O)-methyltransferase